nr:hypothetical protein [Candidatus Dependentiae bacterium]
MIIIKEILQNYLMGNKILCGITRKFHRTGINSDRQKALRLYEYYKQFFDVKNKSILEIGPGQTLDILKFALNDGSKYCSALDIV